MAVPLPQSRPSRREALRLFPVDGSLGGQSSSVERHGMDATQGETFPDDQQIVEAASQMLGLREPVTLRRPDDLGSRDVGDGQGDRKTRACYQYVQGMGHFVQVIADRKGMGLMTSICHELVHARQREDDGQFFLIRYRAFSRDSSYDDNRYEVEARTLGAELASILAEGVA